MANLDRPLGFRAVASGVAGTAPRISEYAVSATLSDAIFEGDLVYKGALGVAVVNDATSITQVQNLVGAAVNYVAASPGADAVVSVYDDPEQRFMVQVDDNALSTAALLIESIGKAARVVATTGSVTSQQSRMELDGSSITSTAQTATETWDCVQIYGMESLSVASGSWADVYVKIRATHHLYSGNNPRAT